MNEQTIPRQHPPKLWKLWLEAHDGVAVAVPTCEEWFHRLLLTKKNAGRIARNLGVGQATVYRWMDWYGFTFDVAVTRKVNRL